MSDNKAAIASQFPFQPIYSPVPLLIGMFLLGYILMRWVHWGYEMK